MLQLLICDIHNIESIKKAAKHYEELTGVLLGVERTLQLLQ